MLYCTVLHCTVLYCTDPWQEVQVPGPTATEKQETGDMGAGDGKKKLGSGSDLSKEEKIGEEVWR